VTKLAHAAALALVGWYLMLAPEFAVEAIAATLCEHQSLTGDEARKIFQARASGAGGEVNRRYGS
jgi:hypothetical protein